jgi:hypothetical protein
MDEEYSHFPDRDLNDCNSESEIVTVTNSKVQPELLEVIGSNQGIYIKSHTK